MIRYTIKRLILAFITVFIILSLTYILIKALPFERPVGNDSVKYSYYMDQVHQGFVLAFSSPQTKYGEILFTYIDPISNLPTYFYQRPILDQYFQWLSNIFTRWDWGTSEFIEVNVDAGVIIAKRLQPTILINIFSVIWSVPLGILLGIWAALKKNTAVDNIISTLVMIFISIPGFVLITFMMYWFCYQLHWLPTQWPDSSTASTAEIVKGYILPVFVLSFGPICGYCRFTRAELCEVMESDYLLLARTKGLTKKQAILRHALRNAMVPIVPSILAEVIGILGGSMILEQLYGIPGIGSLFVLSLSAKDYNVLFVDMAIFTTISLVANVFLDISYGFIDPRIRMGAKHEG